MGEDVGHYGGSYKVSFDLYKKYGEMRLLDTPICENAFLGMGIGAAMTGLRPIIEGMNMGTYTHALAHAPLCKCVYTCMSIEIGRNMYVYTYVYTITTGPQSEYI